MPATAMAAKPGIGTRIVVDSALSRLYAERNLRENEQRFSDIVYSMADWVWKKDGSLKGYREINKDITFTQNTAYALGFPEMRLRRSPEAITSIEISTRTHPAARTARW